MSDLAQSLSGMLGEIGESDWRRLGVAQPLATRCFPPNRLGPLQTGTLFVHLIKSSRCYNGNPYCMPLNGLLRADLLVLHARYADCLRVGLKAWALGAWQPFNHTTTTTATIFMLQG